MGEISGKNPYTYCKNNPIKYIDPDGRDEEQRDAAISQAKRNIDEKEAGNQYLMGAKGSPGNKVDCSGLVSNAVIAGGEDNPNTGNKSSGVLNIESNTQKVSDQEATSGNIVTFKFNKGYPYHTGIVTNFVKDGDDNITSFTMIHSSSGKGPNEQTVTIGEGKLGNGVNGFYKWDTKPDPVVKDIPNSTSTLYKAPTNTSNEGIKGAWYNFINDIYSAISKLQNLPSQYMGR